MGLTRIREGCFTRFDRQTCPQPDSALNHHVLPLFSPSPLIPYDVAVSPLLVHILDPPATKPSVEPSGLDAGRCGRCVRSRADLESEERYDQRQEGCAARCFVRP